MICSCLKLGFLLNRELLLNNNQLRVLPFELGKLFQLQTLGLKGEWTFGIVFFRPYPRFVLARLNCGVCWFRQETH